jgi:hypothetical protein
MAGQAVKGKLIAVVGDEVNFKNCISPVFQFQF